LSFIDVQFLNQQVINKYSIQLDVPAQTFVVNEEKIYAKNTLQTPYWIKGFEIKICPFSRKH
jgi:hypothetical protein